MRLLFEAVLLASCSAPTQEIRAVRPSIRDHVVRIEDGLGGKICPGDSGGGVFDANGDLVAIGKAFFTDTRQDGAVVEWGRPMNYDATNALFELVALFFGIASCVKLHRDEEVRGIFWPQVGWSGLWAIWAVFYYYGVGHYLSVCIASLRACCTLIWLSMMYSYEANE